MNAARVQKASIPRHDSNIDDAKRPRVQSAARVAQILMHIASDERGLTTREISDRVGASMQVIYHLLHTLTEEGLLYRNAQNRCVLGLSVASLAEGLRRQHSGPEYLSPVVRKLAQQSGETSYVAGWVNGEATTLVVARGSNSVHAQELPPGFSADAHSRAAGKLLLAFAPAADRKNYLDCHSLHRRTPHTICDRSALEAELNRIAVIGHACDLQEFAEGLSCLAVPIHNGLAPFALCLSTPHVNFERRRKQLLAMLEEAATSLLPRLISDD